MSRLWTGGPVPRRIVSYRRQFVNADAIDMRTLSTAAPSKRLPEIPPPAARQPPNIVRFDPCRKPGAAKKALLVWLLLATADVTPPFRVFVSLPRNACLGAFLLSRRGGPAMLIPPKKAANPNKGDRGKKKNQRRFLNPGDGWNAQRHDGAESASLPGQAVNAGNEGSDSEQKKDGKPGRISIQHFLHVRDEHEILWPPRRQPNAEPASKRAGRGRPCLERAANRSGCRRRP